MKEEKINKDCECPYECYRHGKCEECRDYHHSRGEETHCGK
jgi:hypothetical protein